MNRSQSGHALDALGCLHGPENTQTTQMWLGSAAGRSPRTERGEAAWAGTPGKVASRLLTVRQPECAAVISTQATVRLHRRTLASPKKSELTMMDAPLEVVVEGQTCNLESYAPACWIAAWAKQPRTGLPSTSTRACACCAPERMRRSLENYVNYTYDGGMPRALRWRRCSMLPVFHERCSSASLLSWTPVASVALGNDQDQIQPRPST